MSSGEEKGKYLVNRMFITIHKIFFLIILFINDSKRSVFYYFIKETTLVKFIYPSVLIIKGSCRSLLYSVSENLYYYLKLPTPILIESMSITQNSYGFELIYLMDMGDYLILFNFALPYSAGDTFTWNLHKRYQENLTFQRLTSWLLYSNAS